jgi:hypothetical protein
MPFSFGILPQSQDRKSLIPERFNKPILFIIKQIENCWNEQLADSLLKIAREAELKTTCMRTILD